MKFKIALTSKGYITKKEIVVTQKNNLFTVNFKRGFIKRVWDWMCRRQAMGLAMEVFPPNGMYDRPLTREERANPALRPKRKHYEAPPETMEFEETWTQNVAGSRPTTYIKPKI